VEDEREREGERGGERWGVRKGVKWGVRKGVKWGRFRVRNRAGECVPIAPIHRPRAQCTEHRTQ
jgi:hypothetical protein